MSADSTPGQPLDVLIAGGGVAGIEGAPALRARYFSAHLTGGHGWGSEVAEEPLGEHPPKIAAKYLAPYLEQRDPAA